MNEPGPAPQGVASVICFGTSDRPRTQSARAAHTSKYFANPDTGRNVRNRKRQQTGSEIRSVSDYGHGKLPAKNAPPSPYGQNASDKTVFALSLQSIRIAATVRGQKIARPGHSRL